MQPTTNHPNGIIVSAIVGLVVGVLVAIVCYLLGGIQHLTFLRTYDYPIGVVAGILTFLQRWLGWNI